MADLDIAIVDDTVLSSPAGVDSRFPKVDVDETDRVHIVWENTAQGEVRYAQLDAQGWVAIADQAVFQGSQGLSRSHPAVAVDAQGHPHIVFAEQTATCAVETDYVMLDGLDGSVRIAPTVLSNDDCIASGHPNLGLAANDPLFVTFEDTRLGTNQLFAMGLDPSLDDQNGDAATASVIVLPDALVSDNAGGAIGASNAVVSAQGTLHAVFFDEALSAPGTDLLFQTMDGTGAVLRQETSLSEGPSAGAWIDEPVSAIVTDAASTHIAWTDVSGAHPRVVLLTIGPDDDRDGLSNGREAELGTSRGDPDTDNDGVSDYDEAMGGSVPLDASSLP